MLLFIQRFDESYAIRIGGTSFSFVFEIWWWSFSYFYKHNSPNFVFKNSPNSVFKNLINKNMLPKI